MSLTYQQQYILSGAAARGAILDLTARHNRYRTDGDKAAWIATFKHSGAEFIRDGETFTDLRAAFDGGAAGRLVTLEHEISVDGVDATQRCVAVLIATGATGSGIAATGIYHDRLVYERGAWYFASRELRWDKVPHAVALAIP